MVLDILVVDDHPLMRAGLQCVLDETSDLRVVATAAGGAEAVALAGALRPHIALMDLSMPDMDGLEATRRLRALDPAPAVVVLTSTSAAALVRQSFAAGACGYLLKDMSPDRMVAALRGLPLGRPAIDPRIARTLARLDRPVREGQDRDAAAPTSPGGPRLS